MFPAPGILDLTFLYIFGGGDSYFVFNLIQELDIAVGISVMLVNK